MDAEDPGFFAEMAKELEASARKLEAREEELAALLGEERVAELAALWARELDPEDEAELKTSMDWDDKEIIWVWARLERARARRVLVGREVMRHVHYGQELEQEKTKDAKDAADTKKDTETKDT